MANSIIGGSPPSLPGITIIEGDYRAPDDMPTGTICKITKGYRPYDSDVYHGRMKDLIAAGFVTADMFPPQDKSHVTFLAGVRMLKRRCIADETYRRVARTEKDGVFNVAVGIPRDVVAARRRAEKEQNQALRAAEVEKTRAQQLSDAERALCGLIKTERQFRIDTLDHLRSWVRVVLSRVLESSDSHGFTLTDEGADDIRLSFDAIAEAVMRAEVRCDHAKQTRIVAELQAKVIAAGGGAPLKVASVVRPNEALLQGEAP